MKSPHLTDAQADLSLYWTCIYLKIKCTWLLSSHSIVSCCISHHIEHHKIHVHVLFIVYVFLFPITTFSRGHYEEYFSEIFNFGPVVKEEMSFKDISIFNSGCHFVQWSRMVCAIWQRALSRIFLRNKFEIRPVVKDMLFKGISIFSLVAILFIGA